MGKLAASVLMKVPVPGIPYSNQEFSAVREVEVPESATDEEVQQRLQELYAMLARSVEAQIGDASDAAKSNRGDQRNWRNRNQNNGGDGRRGGWGDGRNRQDRRNDGGRGNGSQRGGRWQSGNGNGSRQGGWRSGNNGNGSRGGQASSAQVKAVYAIAKDRGIEERDVMERVEDLYNVQRVEDLSVQQASDLIESLKAA